MTADDNLRKPPKKYKDPDAVKDYSVNWLPWLTREDGTVTDALETSVWLITVAPDESLTVDSDSFTSPDTTVWLSGGTPGQSYWVTNRVTTIEGRTDDQSVIIVIKEM